MKYGNMTRLGRREFLVRLSVLGLGLVFLALAGCESSSTDGNTSAANNNSSASSSNPTNQPASLADKAATISANHGHTATMTASEQTDGQAVTIGLTTASTDGHTHSVSFTASQVQAIASGGTASSQSTMTEGHTHTVSF